MPTVPFVKFQSASEKLVEAINLGSDTFKIALSNTAPNAATDDELADIVEIAAGTGYTAGGVVVATVSSVQTGGVYKLICNDAVFTATGAMGPQRYAVLYDDTAAGKPLIGYWDYGVSFPMSLGETLTIDLDAIAGVLTLT